MRQRCSEANSPLSHTSLAYTRPQALQSVRGPFFDGPSASPPAQKRKRLTEGSSAPLGRRRRAAPETRLPVWCLLVAPLHKGVSVAPCRGNGVPGVSMQGPPCRERGQGPGLDWTGQWRTAAPAAHSWPIAPFAPSARREEAVTARMPRLGAGCPRCLK